MAEFDSHVFKMIKITELLTEVNLRALFPVLKLGIASFRGNFIFRKVRYTVNLKKYIYIASTIISMETK